ncbi:glycosyltransferase [Trichocoleus sp. FACHB-262]|uniref:glycosyltransferase n=1 Tax=Trichocoleus sp. FACHB-262 TaxID=2692869 RepID=UPI001681F0D9|nr:glycosyltransferase [Trichocoleus sp. FACHB-262]MBD2119534.1 glycosyltransferase [Trichocoleus sp. FACHB-262]
MISPISIVEGSPNFSGNTRSRLKQRTLLFRYLAEINLILGAWYLYWRVNNSINFDVLWLSIPLLLAEIYSYIGGLMFTIGLWRPLSRQVKSLDQLTPAMPASSWPTLDVFVTCYNESVDIVERTTRAALAMDYPVTKLRVYILDDGNSSEIRAMAERLALEDLQLPQLQEEVARLSRERVQLATRLEELKQLEPDTQAAEAFLEDPSTINQGNLVFGWLQSLQKLALMLNPGHSSLCDRLSAEEKQTEQSLHHKELELSEVLRCRYIARPKPAGKPHYAKAGNINYAIFAGGTAGEFILTLDADHIPKPHFLKRVLSYFYTYNVATGRYDSNRIAFVQTPQDFYNIPPGDPFGHRANLFYGPIQQGKDGLNSAFYTGTNAILRREALVNVGLRHFFNEYNKNERQLSDFDLVGGMSSNSITEDMNTAMRLHANGWKSIYHNEVLAEGLAPDDLSSTLKQRLRWAQGTMQVMVRENPFTKPGLTFWQRLQYFQTMYSYLSGFATVIFIACPIIYFFTGIIPVTSFGPDFAIHFFPAFILNRLTFMVAGWGVPAREIWRSEQYAIALFPLFIQAVVSVFTNRPIRFQVTPKQRQAGIYLGLVIPQLTVFVLTILGIVWSLYRLVTGTLEDPAVHLINAAWSVYNLALLLVIIRAAVWQPE